MRHHERADGQPGNFWFLEGHQPVLLAHAIRAERYVFEDPNTALFKLRQLAEFLAKEVAAKLGIVIDPNDTFLDVERRLRDRGALNQQLRDVMRTVRTKGNSAAHSFEGERRDALHCLKLVRQLAIWFHKTVTNAPHFKAGPFVPPADPAQGDSELAEELARLRETVAKQQAELDAAKAEADKLSDRVKEARTAYQLSQGNEQAALELAAETEETLQKRVEEYERLLAEIAAENATQPAETQEELIEASQQAAQDIDLDEFDTRKLIDQQLRDAGWEADTAELRYANGTRPQKGRNLAIAEVPTDDGIADYVLFNGLTPIATVEAKRKRRNARSAIDQAHRYAVALRMDADYIDNGGPWGNYRVPFVFATNGSPYHRQLIDQSGIWFRDVRIDTNHPRALTGWYTPEGLQDLLKLDIGSADQALATESSDYLPLRYYQRDAIESVEQAIARGQTEILLAMATGTGKTRTAICLLYRLVKAGRFNRILFVVDRRSLGEQAFDAFKDVKLEQNQSFPEIYDVKQLGDVKPDRDTKLHVCTIQSMVKRVVDSDTDSDLVPVDQYDCIVIDECHRGYTLDREMSEEELGYRDQLDYVSKYRRVLDHFDAVRIGLTATPALHTTEIFGRPVYQYSYRQAVIDSNLVDHEPPFIIRTELSESGMHWDRGESVKYFDAVTKSIATETTPDEIDIEIDGFNSRAITENFNKVVCDVLADHIDHTQPGKTLIFCVRDSHADMVVRLLTQAIERKHGPQPHDTVKKITGEIDRTSEAIRRFKNEGIPKYVVTVDLLTTGIDVPEITNVVFLRRTKSRILFDQMIGRATRLCKDLYFDGEDKEYFHIYDAVGVYEALQSHTDMKPVVAKPSTTFKNLVDLFRASDLSDVPTDIRQQLVAKLRRKTPSINKYWLGTFELLADNSPESVADLWENSTDTELKNWLTAHPSIIKELDRRLGDGAIPINEQADTLVSVQRGYGAGQRPEDYLESFRRFLIEHASEIPVLTLVTTRPRDLTRKDLKELQLQLEQNGFNEAAIKSAVRDTTNQDIAASILGFVRHAMLNEPLLPYEERVDQAMRTILGSQTWLPKQRQWLQRIGKQLKENVVVDRELFDAGAFREKGGFVTLNKVFDGRLEELMQSIVSTIWQTAS
ncbi:type I restriction-modification system endonuclease [Novipirellula sp.]|uniref:type I restriction-modification system endonuclease n=1 Tax=Novipirellula sp. TaxID=2795430 RepID=UPI0035621849